MTFVGKASMFLSSYVPLFALLAAVTQGYRAGFLLLAVASLAAAAALHYRGPAAARPAHP